MATSAVKNYVLRGLDHFTKEELDNFWNGYDAKKDEPKILGIGLSCSFQCNYKCVYCYAGEKTPDKDELSLQEQKDLISQANKLGAKTVVMCGDAEPMMDKNLLPIVAYANELGMVSVVVSNGAVIGDDSLSKKIHGKDGKSAAQFLYDHGASLILKMDSIDPERYDQLVGVKGSYKKFRTAIDRFSEIGFGKGEDKGKLTVTRMAFSGVIMKMNIDELEAMRSFADSVGAQFICKLPTLVGRALENLDIMYPVEKYEEIRKHLLKYTAKRETLMVDTPRCIAWHYGPVISIKGEVRECYTSEPTGEKRIGNVRENSLKDLMKLRNQKYDITCKDFCPVKTRINKELVEKGKDMVWKVLPENALEECKHF